MRILLVHNNFDVQGGAEVFYHDIGRVLEENGHEVAYFSAAGSGESEQWDKYFPVVSEYKDGSSIQKVISFPQMVYSRKSHRCITELMKVFKPHVVHAFATYVKLTPSVLSAAKSMGVPVVMSCNDYKHICPNYKLYHSGRICEECKGGKFYRAAVNKCCHGSTTYSTASMLEAYSHGAMDIYRKNVDLFLFASKFMARKTEEFWGKDTFRWAQLCNPFDFESNSLESTVGDYGLYFGRLIEEKGVHRLIEAAKQIPNRKIVIVGDGPDTPMLQAMIDDAKLKNISLVGPKWGDALHELLANCRFAIVPSIWHENFPYVIFQAFAAGKAVLGSNRGGITELVSDEERGWIYDVDNIDELASKMEMMFTMQDSKLEAIGDTVRNYIKKEFNDDKICSDLESIYRSVLA